MANKPSAMKRIRQNAKRRERNRLYKGKARSCISEARLAIEQGDVDTAKEATLKAVSALDKAAIKGILHKKNVARRKSRLMKQLAVLEKESAE